MLKVQMMDEDLQARRMEILAYYVIFTHTSLEVMNAPLLLSSANFTS